MAETVAVRRGRARFWLFALLWLVVALVLAAAIGGYAFLRASLPTLDGESPPPACAARSRWRAMLGACR